MIGSIDTRTRPVRLAYLVDPGASTQVREAIRLSSTLWGGPYSPIIPLHRRMPSTWREKGFKTPVPRDVTLGYIEGFDPDILVQLAKEIPGYITELGLRLVRPHEVWDCLEKRPRARQSLE